MGAPTEPRVLVSNAKSPGDHAGHTGNTQHTRVTFMPLPGLSLEEAPAERMQGTDPLQGRLAPPHSLDPPESQPLVHVATGFLCTVHGLELLLQAQSLVWVNRTFASFLFHLLPSFSSVAPTCPVPTTAEPVAAQGLCVKISKILPHPLAR